MGRQGQAWVEFGGQAGESRLLLEAEGLTLRGSIRADLPRAGFGAARAEGAVLHLQTAQGDLSARMPTPAEAARWLQALTKPPPSLADKLGLGPGRGLWLLGAMRDPVLADCLRPWLSPSGPQALAELHDDTELAALLSALPDRPLWVVTLKGKSSPLGENRVRAALRALGWRDVKTARVSDQSAATRYLPPAPGSQPGPSAQLGT